MKTINSILSIVFVLTLATDGSGQDKKRHPLGYNIYKPQIIMHFAKELGLEEEQREFVLSEVAEMEKFAATQKARLELETEKFQHLLAKRITGEDEAEVQGARMLNAEKAVRSVELKLIVRLKNQLTREQNRKLQNLTREFDHRKLHPDSGQQKRIHAKMEKLQAGMREMADLGVSPEKIQRLTGRANLLFQVGLFADGEKILEQAIKALDNPF